MSNAANVIVPLWVRAQFTGLNGAGVISVPGLQAGDVIIKFDNGNWEGFFEGPTIAISNQLQQTAGSNLSGVSFNVLLIRGLIG